MKLPRPRLAVPAVLILLFASPVGARACAVCMGADENTGEALNGAIFLMLGCIGFVMSLIVGAAYSIWRRSQSVLAHPSELSESLLEKP